MEDVESKDIVVEDTDLSEKETKSLNRFVGNGCPGILKVVESDIFQWFELYMSGKSYQEIAEISKTKKELILYIAKKAKWHEKRTNHMTALVDTMFQKYDLAKAKNIDTISTMVTALSKYYGDQFNDFIKTNNSSIIEGIDTKMLSQYYKAVEMLEKIMGHSANSGEKPMLNVNISGNASISKKDDNTIDITNDDTASKLLKALVEIKRSENS